jgi:alkanesulfonate monooxygenase SsuD/methylene tetrahydromethanopterin reductase-like flavin-dependent oxidoreductase (luciferase family)
MPQNRARPLKVGLAVAIFERSSVDCTPRWADLKAMAQHAEAVGFDSIWLPDHLLFHLGETRLGVWDHWSILSSLAAITTKIELGTLVTSMAFRNPALLAKMADTVDEISDGRLILGLGAGWHEPEFRAFGYPEDHPIGRFEEALQIICTLLREGAIEFHGEYYHVQNCELLPRASRPGGPPIMIGARRPDRPRTLRLTAQYADYWNGWLLSSLDKLVPALAGIEAACEKVKRDPATLRRSVGLLVDQPQVPGYRASPIWGPFFARNSPLNGSPQQVADVLRSFAEHGIDHVQLYLDPQSIAGIDAFAPVLELLDRG